MAGRTSPAGLERKRLRLWLTLFFVALAAPTAVLVQQAYSEVKWEVFHRYRLQAEELAARIDQRYQQLIKTEEARPFTDFSFLNVLGDTKSNFLQRSVLAAYPVKSEIPGLIGYFQIDADGSFSSPLLPVEQTQALAYGVPESEYRQRLQISLRIHHILSSNRLVSEASGLDTENRPEESDDIGQDKDVFKKVHSQVQFELVFGILEIHLPVLQVLF